MLPRNHKQAERVLIRMVATRSWLVDEAGRIWWCDKQKRAEKRLPSGYLAVRAMLGGKRHNGLAHRLVWQWFNGDIPDGMVVNHRNGIKDDNRPKNLELVSMSDNISHAHTNGLLDEHGQGNPNAKLTNNEVAQIRLAFGSGMYTQAQLAKRFGVSFQHVSKLIRGECRPKQGGPRSINNPRDRGQIKRDLTTGRFHSDGRTWDEMPEVPHAR